jgi:hypothetical protein
MAALAQQLEKNGPPYKQAKIIPVHLRNGLPFKQTLNPIVIVRTGLVVMVTVPPHPRHHRRQNQILIMIPGVEVVVYLPIKSPS